MPTSPKSISLTFHLAACLLRLGADAYVATAEGRTSLHTVPSFQIPHVNSEEELRRGDDIVPLARELITQGSPLERESSVIRDPSVTAKTPVGVDMK